MLSDTLYTRRERWRSGEKRTVIWNIAAGKYPPVIGAIMRVRYLKLINRIALFPVASLHLVTSTLPREYLHIYVSEYEKPT